MRGSIVRPNAKNRRKSYAVVIYLGRDPQSGKERRKWASFKTLREAEAHLSRMVAHVQGGGTLPNARLRTGDYLRAWLRDYVAVSVAPTTQQIYGDAIKMHILPDLGQVPLVQLSAQSIESLLSRKIRIEKKSAATVHKVYRVLRTALGHAVRKGLLTRNPCEMLTPPRLSRKQLPVLDEEQVRLFLGEAKKTSPYYRLYLTALSTGMRQGELLGLRWKDVNLALGIASVQQTFYRLWGNKKENIRAQMLFKEPKSPKARRTVDLPATVVEELRSLQHEQTEQRLRPGARGVDYGLVFCQRNGKPLHAHNVARRDFRKVLERAGLPRIRFHDLRHSHATLLLQQGVHPKIVQERLGHATIGMTLDTYSHTVQGMQRAAVAAFEVRVLGQAMSNQQE